MTMIFFALPFFNFQTHETPERKVQTSPLMIGYSFTSQNINFQIIKDNGNEREVTVTGSTISEGTLVLYSVVRQGQLYNVVEIANSAFNSKGFTGPLIVPENVRVIGDHAFYMTKCTSLVLPESLLEIRGMAFANNFNMAGPLTIPSNVWRIGGMAFYGCWSFDFLVLPSSIKEIEHDAFGMCYRMKGEWKNMIPPFITEIPAHAFYYCPLISGPLTIHSGIKSIGEWAFNSCTGITKITYLGDCDPAVNVNVFEGVAITRVNVKTTYSGTKFASLSVSKIVITQLDMFQKNHKDISSFLHPKVIHQENYVGCPTWHVETEHRKRTNNAKVLMVGLVVNENM